MHDRKAKISAVGTVMILSLWAISVGMFLLGVAQDLEMLRLPA
ncbi:hypothetical protein SSCG_00860 [Streptomyces clavuligerus]|nr:hypothetical protein [Streptomyces clavuligerus]EDY47832.1 hypothetical protein SSCG_00860 [Streptomyces clavuligerus]